MPMFDKRQCNHCGSVVLNPHSNCPQCGAPLPLAKSLTNWHRLPIIVVILFIFVYELKQSIVTHTRPNAIQIYSNSSWLDDFKTKIIAVNIIQETEQSLILEVDYNFAESDAGRSQVYVLPDMPYWSQSIAYVQPGRNQVTVAVDLNSDKMKADGVSSVTSSRLSASLARYTETAYLGEITANHIPYKKRWAL